MTAHNLTDPRQAEIPLVDELPTGVAAARGAPHRPKATAVQKDISVSEFFSKNRHLLGFDNPSRALLTTVKEAVDNSLDACEEAEILPELAVAIVQLSETRFLVRVRDNGPGIARAVIPNVFGKLLYGSKFHRLRQSRGQQGIGISAAGMYGLLTTGAPVRILSRTDGAKAASRYEVRIDTGRNKPVVVSSTSEEVDWPHGTEVEITLEATYKAGKRSVEAYLRQVALSNPHALLRYEGPGGRQQTWERAVERLPVQPEEIKPHPHGVELGVFLQLLQQTRHPSLLRLLTREFSRVSDRAAQELCAAAGVDPRLAPRGLDLPRAQALYQALQAAKLRAPSTACLSPIGEEAIMQGILQLLVTDEAGRAAHAIVAPSGDDAAANPLLLDEGAIEVEGELPGIIKVGGAEYYITAVTRAPRVYRGNPFQVEVGLAYGGRLPGDELAELYRFANRVPLLYQQSACAVFRAAVEANWRNYRISQSKGALPSGPLLLFAHLASVWVPFTSESKEAIAHYDVIVAELKAAYQEAGRRLALHIGRVAREAEADKKRKFIERYIPHLGIALQQILALPDTRRRDFEERLTKSLAREQVGA